MGNKKGTLHGLSSDYPCLSADWCILYIVFDNQSINVLANKIRILHVAIALCQFKIFTHTHY